MQSRSNTRKHSSVGHYEGLTDDKEQLEKKVDKSNIVKKSRQKKGGLRSLQVLTAILLSRMGQVGARDLFALVTTVVSFSSLHIKKMVSRHFRIVFLKRFADLTSCWT